MLFFWSAGICMLVEDMQVRHISNPRETVFCLRLGLSDCGFFTEPGSFDIVMLNNLSLRGRGWWFSGYVCRLM